MKNLFKWGKKYIAEIVILIIMLVLLQYLYSYLSLFISYAIKVVDKSPNKSTLPEFILNVLNNIEDPVRVLIMVGVFMVSLQLVRSIMRFSTNYMQGHITQNISFDMKKSLYYHIEDLSYTFHNGADTGDLIQRCTSDVDSSSNFIAQQFPNLIQMIATIIFGAVQISKINITMMLVSIVTLPITIVSSILYFKYSGKLIENAEEKESEMTTAISENVNSARVVKAFNNEAYEIEKIEKKNKAYANESKKWLKVMSIYWGASDFIVMAQYAITMITGIILAKKGIIDSSQIAACLLLMGMLVWPMRGLGRIVSNFGKSVVAANRIEEILEKDDEYKINGTLKPVISGNIEFKDVSFKFDDSDKHLLDSISFKINRGETVAIMGKTGSGKSTICNILTRFLEYDKGNIYLDQTELKDIEKKYLRSNVKMVLQDPFLFSKSVYENIAISDTEIDSQKIYEAASIASIHKEINEFNKGYETMVGEKGTTLSGGQKQRIAIARILISDCPILIFDDSLSALDSKTDLMIRRALKVKNKNQTTIIITHRITTAMEADKIIVLDKGKVSNIGTHESLKEEEGLYKDLWAIQGKLLEDFKAVQGEVE